MEHPVSDPSPEVHSGRNDTRLLWGIGLAAVTLFLVGGWAALRSAVGPDANHQNASNIVSTKEDPTAIHERKSPASFGLPSPPTAFSFESMAAGPSRGSSAFEVKQGSAATVSAFYVEKLGAKGWVFLSQKPVDVRPDEHKTTVFHGVRTEWIHKQLGRHLALTALDDARPDHKAQVALSWSPIVMVAPGKQ